MYAQLSKHLGFTDVTMILLCGRSFQSMLAVVLLMTGTLTAAANVWGLKRINNRMLRQIGPRASALLGREVCVTFHASVVHLQTCSHSFCHTMRRHTLI